MLQKPWQRQLAPWAPAACQWEQEDQPVKGQPEWQMELVSVRPSPLGLLARGLVWAQLQPPVTDSADGVWGQRDRVPGAALAAPHPRVRRCG